ICGRRPNSGQRITSTSRNLVPSRSPSTKRWPILPRILIQCGGCLDATVKKAVWNSNKLRRFPKANLIIYSSKQQGDKSIGFLLARTRGKAEDLFKLIDQDKQILVLGQRQVLQVFEQAARPPRRGRRQK